MEKESNLLDYLRWRGDLSMEAVAWNVVDALILARLSYAPFSLINLQSRQTPVLLGDAAQALLAEPDLAEAVLQTQDPILLSALANSPRFAACRLIGYVDQFDPEQELQFSAVSVLTGGETAFVCFRGTDDTLVGWKEDLNMSFTFPVPAQRAALEYLERLAPLLPKNLVLAGHSKGGNLAVYAAAFCSETLQNRITAVFNFDGPGFDSKVLDTKQYHAVCGRITTFLPQSSIVGMLLEHEEAYTVVKSSQHDGIHQHNVYSWVVERDHMVQLDRVTGSSQYIDRTLKGWIRDLEPEQREKFIDALFEIVSQTNARTLGEMSENRLENAKAIFLSLKNMDETTRKLIQQALSVLMKNARSSLTELREEK